MKLRISYRVEYQIPDGTWHPSCYAGLDVLTAEWHMRDMARFHWTPTRIVRETRTY